MAWAERFNHDELSAIQHAMNLKLQDEAAFFAEYQNEPLPEDTGTEDELTPEQIAGKTNRMPRRAVPIGCNHLTMFVNVQVSLLFFVVAASMQGVSLLGSEPEGTVQRRKVTRESLSRLCY